MVLKNIELLNLSEAIIELVNSNNELSIKTIYRLNKNLKKMEELRSLIEQQRNNIVLKAKDNNWIDIDSNGHIQIIPGNEIEAQNFVNELNELYSIDNEIELETFALDELGDIKFSGTNKMIILKIINEE